MTKDFWACLMGGLKPELCLTSSSLRKVSFYFEMTTVCLNNHSGLVKKCLSVPIQTLSANAIFRVEEVNEENYESYD